MTKITLLNNKAEKIEDIKLNDEIFGIEPNKNVLHDAIILARAALRQGTHKTKTRAEVSGGGKKPWRQKGTGRARAGSTRSPIWVGGGVATGVQPRDYSKKQNRKERKLALKSALAAKVNDMVLVQDITLATPKTKDVISFLTSLKLNDVKTLIVVKMLDENLILATRNLSNIVLIEASEINVLDLIAADKVLITKEAIESIEEVLK